MKKLLITCVYCFGLLFSSFAQEESRLPEPVRALHKAYKEKKQNMTVTIELVAIPYCNFSSTENEPQHITYAYFQGQLKGVHEDWEVLMSDAYYLLLFHKKKQMLLQPRNGPLPPEISQVVNGLTDINQILEHDGVSVDMATRNGLHVAQVKMPMSDTDYNMEMHFTKDMTIKKILIKKALGAGHQHKETCFEYRLSERVGTLTQEDFDISLYVEKRRGEWHPNEAYNGYKFQFINP